MVYPRVKEHEWLYHYEVYVRRHGRDQLVARVPSRAHAAAVGAQLRRHAEISWSSVGWRRARGIHPANAARLVAMVLVVALLLPWFWPRLALSLVCTAVICGLLSSGTRWKQGGEDDR